MAEPPGVLAARALDGVAPSAAGQGDEGAALAAAVGSKNGPLLRVGGAPVADVEATDWYCCKRSINCCGDICCICAGVRGAGVPASAEPAGEPLAAIIGGADAVLVGGAPAGAALAHCSGGIGGA